MMESIEKLRELLKGCGCSDQCYSCSINYHGSIVDEIEAEIESRYMLLPVDADGVPIRVGDELRGYGLPDGGAIVKALNGTMVIVGRLEGGENYAKSGLLWSASETRHYNPRTIEDVLADFASKQHGITKEENDALIAECAEEIRELMEVRDD